MSSRTVLLGHERILRDQIMQVISKRSGAGRYGTLYRIGGCLGVSKALRIFPGHN